MGTQTGISGKQADLSGWGRFPRLTGRLTRIRSVDALRKALGPHPVIARGNGRSYGDSAVQVQGTLDMRGMAHMLSFDDATGVLVAQVGVLLGDVIDSFLPRGWFPPVTPGTKFVTLGGMLAADVHGKNHLRDGSIRQHVDWIEVLGPDGQIRRASSTENPELFDWTLGGMGLTGVILRCALRLRRIETGYIRQTLHVAENLDQAIEVFEAASSRYAVAWFDCLGQGAALGRSVVMLGDHAEPEDLEPAQRAAPYDIPRRRPLRMPVDAPGFALNRHTLRAFNAVYYRAQARKAGESLVDWDRYFYPLDAVLGWNRIYGRRGFAQYQVVIPLASARAGLTDLLGAISDAGAGSFLAVLKRLGPEAGPMSFPMEGYTLALDFPVSDAVLALLTRLDAITAAHGGRAYLAKDSRMTAETFHKTDPRAARFAAYRDGIGARGVFASAQSERVKL